MITYLLDTSALWHLFRTPERCRPGRDTSPPGCSTSASRHVPNSSTRQPARLTGTNSRRNWTHSATLSPVPESAWRWVDTAQYKLTQQGQHRAAGAIDLLVCATAVHHGHTVLHVDNDFATVAGVLKEVQQRDVRA